MFSFGHDLPRRSFPSIAAIDLILVVILFAAFTMAPGQGRGLSVAVGQGAYTGAPRLVTVGRDAIALNGVEMAPRELLLGLIELTGTGGDTVVIEPMPGTSTARLVEVVGLLGAAGFSSVTVVGGGS